MWYSKVQYGDIVNWKTAQWNVSNMDTYEASYEDICQPAALGMVFVPGKFNVTAAANLCKILRGVINVVDSRENNERVVDLMLESDSCGGLSKLKHNQC